MLSKTLVFSNLDMAKRCAGDVFLFGRVDLLGRVFVRVPLFVDLVLRVVFVSALLFCLTSVVVSPCWRCYWLASPKEVASRRPVALPRPHLTRVMPALQPSGLSGYHRRHMLLLLNRLYPSLFPFKRTGQQYPFENSLLLWSPSWPPRHQISLQHQHRQ